MTSGGSNRAAYWFSFVVLASLLVALLPTGQAAIARQFPGEDPKVTDGRRTLESPQLSSTTLSRLSGLRANTVSAQYTASSGDTINCAPGPAGRIKYTLDGTAPNANSHSTNLVCTSPGFFGATVVGSIQPKDFQNATNLNTVVTFLIEIDEVDATVHTDNNNGAFFRYRIDRTAGNMTAKTPSQVADSSIPDAVTASTTPAVSFTVKDSNTEAPLNTTSLAIEVDGSDRTSAFNCSTPDAFTWSCQMDYAKLPSGFTFAPGTHTVRALGADQAGNEFDAANSTIRIRVDQTKPEVKNVTATANQAAGTSGGLPIVSRGGTLRVTANVEDVNVNKHPNATDSAMAVVFNRTSTTIPASAAFPMKFNATSGKFEGNVTVPTTWPEQAFAFAVRVIGKDLAGNTATNETATDRFVLDPILPVVNEKNPPGPFITDTSTRVQAEVTDQGSGINPDEVKISFSNLTGSFKTPPTATKVGTGNNSFQAKMNRIGATNNFTYDIPAANADATISYQITAKDKGGGTTSTSARTLTVDVAGPKVAELNTKPFRSRTPYVFEFSVSDEGAGVNTTAGKLFYSTGGSFLSVPLVRDEASGRYLGTISPSVTDGQEIRYYAEMFDLLRNVGRNGTAAAPNKNRVDLVAPTITRIVSPPTASGTTFAVEWDATDSGSGVANFTLEARVNDGTPTIWIPILAGTTDKTLNFCGEGGHKYEFRVTATDVAGNRAPLPANPQTSTTLSGDGCEEQVLTTITAPTASSVIDAAVQPTYTIRFTASSTRTFTPSSELRVDVLFSPDGQFWHSLAANIQNTGEYRMDATTLPSCPACRIQIVARTLTGASDAETSPAFALRNGDAEADLDANGLPDAWEVLYVGKVGEADPDADSDGDGLSNVEESRLGTDPENRDTDGDGASDRAESRAGTNALDVQDVPTLAQARTDEYTNWYWTVPGIFLAVTILFFVGLARRW